MAGKEQKTRLLAAAPVLGVVVVGPYLARVGVGEVEGAAVGAPARAVGADDALVELCDASARVETKEAADRIALLVVHVARDEAALSVDLAVVHPDPRFARVGIGELAAGSARKVERIEAVAQRDNRATCLDAERASRCARARPTSAGRRRQRRRNGPWRQDCRSRRDAVRRRPRAGLRRARHGRR